MPVDKKLWHMEPHPEGDARLVNYYGEVVRCFVVDGPGERVDPLKIGRRPHWDTCAEAPRFKAKAERAERVKREAEERRAAEEAAAAARREEQEALGRQVTLFELAANR